MIKYCFQSKSVKFNIDLLKYSKSLPLNVKQSKKYIQIKKTLVEVGLIEPIIIYIDGGSNEVKVVDGHLRIEALKELGETEVKCLISTVYDTYTPNSRVNRITIIQEQKMIQQAIKSGVSIEKLSAALDISIDTLKGKITILNGIAPEVISIFSNLNVPKGTLYILKKMKPMRQIECSNIMVNLDNFSRQFALSLLHSSPIGLLVHGDQKNKSQR
ncbi:ParB/RepB/Spo0J family partition protein [Serratia quinivorans]|nr:ParB/RepB/Spo0J family partition protein [Serratia quinivorans]